MEKIDCAFPMIDDIIVTDNIEIAFKNISIAFLIGSSPRKDGMNRSDLLKLNGKIFIEQGKALSEFAKKSVKVLVVGNPANTNCMIALNSAKKLGPENFCALTRLDHNRILGEVSQRFGVPTNRIRKVISWGNHSNTQIPDLSNATIDLSSGTHFVLDKMKLDDDFIQKIVMRGNSIIKARGGRSSAGSAANAAINHMCNWINGTPENDFVSMGIMMQENNPYKISTGIIFSVPCVVSEEGKITIVPGLIISDTLKEKLKLSEKELLEERSIAFKEFNL